MTLYPTSWSTVVLIGSQAIAVAAGILTQIGVARLLLPAAYGSFAIAMSVLGWIELLVGGGLTLALAQTVSADRTRLPEALRWVKRAFVPYAIAVWVVFSMAAGLVARALGDPGLTWLLVIAGFALPATALFSASRELLMGVGASGRQAIAIGSHAVLRAAVIVGVAAVTQTTLGAVFGNAVAALAAAATALLLLRAQIPGVGAPRPAVASAGALHRSVVRSGLPIVLLLLLTQLTLALDLWVVKRTVGDPQAVGWYAAARVFAFVPYMLATGLGLAVFPALCRALDTGDGVRARSLTRAAVRLLIAGLVPLCTVVAATAAPLARLLFSADFGGAAGAMGILTAALSCFSVVGILQGVLIADRKPLLNSVLAGALCVMALLLYMRLVPAYGLTGAAGASAVTGAAGASVLAVYVSRRLGSVVPLATAVRVTLASAGLYAVARVWSVEGPWLIVQYLVLGALYALALVLSREVSRSDLDVARATAGVVWATVRSASGPRARGGRRCPSA